MQPSHHSPQPSSPQAADLVRALARQLHRAAISDSLRVSLPVLRRILATDTLRDLTLPQLHQQRGMVRRKHLLRTLAIEAGHPSWEHYCQALSGMSVEQLPHLDMLQATTGYPNLWFSTREQAQHYALSHGGRVVPVGTQAVVLTHQG
ncbi:MAG TPA: hypothetical protein VFW93_08210 [Aquabacterium sp.]|uniref:hypothetical protein n=1 Tax=Aquabacterium sp. TaxID=1872578 RepID=UPI002E360E26|nr:hypothetical protein [Aquabacterium sp.]HEX5356187.1 hypothetical protein [Aquabacterium sp.]